MKTLQLLVLALSTSLAACATVDTTDDTDATTAASTNRPRFDLAKDAAGYHFTLFATDGTQLVASQTYSSRTSALGGVLSVLANGETDAQYVVRDAVDGGASFDLVATNRHVIASSPLFADETGAKAAIAATERAVDAYIEHWDNATGARFDVFQGADSQFYFDLHARNGAIVLTSQGYSTEASALNGAFSTSENGVTKARYVVGQTSDGRWYFNLTSPNGQVIATGQPYTTKASAQHAVDAIIALLPSVSIL